jgi:hypothetical protein
VFAVREITIENMSSTQSANVTFTFSGQVTAVTSAIGAASASVVSSVRFDRVDVPEFLLSSSSSAPPSNTVIFPPHSFTFDIAPSDSVILISVGSIATDIMVSSPTASAIALGTGVDNEDFTNNSLASIGVHTRKAAASAYTLSLSGVDQTLFNAVASFSVPGFIDQLTTNGVHIVPIESTFTATLGPGETANSLHTSTNEVRVSAVPEPSTYLLFATGLLGIIGYAWRKRKRAA